MDCGPDQQLALVGATKEDCVIFALLTTALTIFAIYQLSCYFNTRRYNTTSMYSRYTSDYVKVSSVECSHGVFIGVPFLR